MGGIVAIAIVADVSWDKVPIRHTPIRPTPIRHTMVRSTPIRLTLIRPTSIKFTQIRTAAD